MYSICESPFGAVKKGCCECMLTFIYKWPCTILWGEINAGESSLWLVTHKRKLASCFVLCVRHVYMSAHLLVELTRHRYTPWQTYMCRVLHQWGVLDSKKLKPNIVQFQLVCIYTVTTVCLFSKSKTTFDASTTLIRKPENSISTGLEYAIQCLNAKYTSVKIVSHRKYYIWVRRLR